MYANSFITAMVLSVATSAVAQELTKPGQLPPPSTPTIGQLAEQARTKRIAEDTAKAAGAGAQTPGAPAGMVIVPSTQIIPGAAAASPAEAAGPNKPAKPVKKAPPPEFVPAILSIYRKGAVRTVELMESNGNARFEAGQVTPSGWTVIKIGTQIVELGKTDPKTGFVRKVSLHLVVN